MSGPQITLLVTLTGRDRPGVTSRLFATLSAHSLAVIDVEQVVIRGRLVLGVLLAAGGSPDLTAIHRQLTSFAADMGMDVEITMGSGEPAERPPGRLHVTLLGRPLLPSAVASIAGRIAAHGANIDSIGRLASRPVTCIEFEVSGADPVGLRNALARESVELGVDVAVQPGGLYRRAMRLVVMDVDSTLLRDEAIDLLAAKAGCAAEVREITTATMRGEIEFAAALRQRVALLAGLDASAIDEVLAGARLTPGARTLIRTLKRLGYWCGVVSGGFTQFTDWLTMELGLDFAEANTLEIAAGKLTGRLVGAIVDRPAKERALRRFAAVAGVPLSQSVAVGDGANDLDMISAAGLGIAFNAKPAVRDAADTSLSVPHLDAILYLLGISREDVDEADAEDTALVADGQVLRTLED
jgi:phosphoserine phosphatase